MKLKISITPEPIELSGLGKLYIGPRMVLGYFIVYIQALGGFSAIFLPIPSTSNMKLLVILENNL